MLTTDPRRCGSTRPTRRFSPPFPGASRAVRRRVLRAAWFKLMHRDMGPRSRYLGPEVPSGGAALAGSATRRQRPPPSPPPDITAAEGQDSGPAACRFLNSCPRRGPRRPHSRGSDKRGGRPMAPRVRLSPQKILGCQPVGAVAPRCSAPSKASRQAFKRKLRVAGRFSLADLIVLARWRGHREGSKKPPGTTSTVPFTPGRVDAAQEQTDVESFAVLEPVADGFRKLPERQVRHPRRVVARGQSAAADPDRPGNDSACGRPARPQGPMPGGSSHGVFDVEARDP